jgi:hypothetical protein
MGSFLLVSLVPLFGSNAVGYLRSRRIVEALVEGYLGEIVGIQARHVSEHLEGQVAYLAAVGAGNRFLQAAAERERPGADRTLTAVASPVAVAEYLRRQLDDTNRFANMALFSLAGGLVASAYDTPRPFR